MNTIENELMEKTRDLIEKVDNYIKSNKDWVFYFLNPIAGGNNELFACMKEHPNDWNEYIDFTIINVSTSYVSITINIDDGSEYGLEIKNYMKENIMNLRLTN